jgi:FkbM family methyltransferase
MHSIMGKNLLVACYLSGSGNLARILKGDDGNEFFHLLASRGARQALYAEPGSHPVNGEPVSGQAPRTRSAGELTAFMSRALEENETVLFISDSPEAVSRVSAGGGCLPVLVTAGGQPCVENNRHIEVASLSALRAYFEGPSPQALFAMLRTQPHEWKSGIERRNARIERQIAASGGAYIFGAHSNGKIVYEECVRTGTKVLGFVDNAVAKQGTTLYDLPVMGPSALDPARAVVILASGNYSLDIFTQLKTVGFQHIQNLSEFFFMAKCPTQPEMYFHDDLWENRIRYHALYLMLADEESRVVLETILRYRQSFDIKLPASICDRNSPQWFDRSLFRPNRDHVFVDGGAFDGDTALRFIRLNGGSYRSIHLFEPDPGIVRQATENLEGFERIHIHNLGLSDRKGTLFFSQTGRMDGHLTETDGLPVRIDAIDHVIDEEVTFLKMDIEGAEESALAGAARHIREDSPMLAIAAYHKADDLWALPRRILGINPLYAFYLRHYTHISHDTVLYGLPTSPRA